MYVISNSFVPIDDVTVDASDGYIHIRIGDTSIGVTVAEAAKLTAQLAVVVREQIELREAA